MCKIKKTKRRWQDKMIEMRDDTQIKGDDCMQEENQEIKRMTPAQVATKLGMSAEGVRAALRQDRFPFRHCFSRKNRSMELYHY